MIQRGYMPSNQASLMWANVEISFWWLGILRCRVYVNGKGLTYKVNVEFWSALPFSHKGSGQRGTKGSRRVQDISNMGDWAGAQKTFWGWETKILGLDRILPQIVYLGQCWSSGEGQSPNQGQKILLCFGGFLMQSTLWCKFWCTVHICIRAFLLMFCVSFLFGLISLKIGHVLLWGGPVMCIEAELGTEIVRMYSSCSPSQGVSHQKLLASEISVCVSNVILGFYLLGTSVCFSLVYEYRDQDYMGK